MVAYLERRRGERFARRRRHVVLQGVGEVVGVGVEEVLRQVDELKQAQILRLRRFPVPVSVKNSSEGGTSESTYKPRNQGKMIRRGTGFARNVRALHSQKSSSKNTSLVDHYSSH